MFVLLNFHINTTKSQKLRQVLKKMFNVNGQKFIFRWNSSGYKLRGNICRKNVVGLVLWDNGQFPRPQAWGSFRHGLSLSLCFSPAERQICTCFFAFRGLSKDWQHFIITKVENMFGLEDTFLLGRWTLDRQETKRQLRVSTHGSWRDP